MEGITSRWSRSVAIAVGVIAAGLGLLFIGTFVAVAIALVSLGGGLVLWGPGKGATRRISEALILVAVTIAMFPIIALVYGVRAPYVVGPDPVLVLATALAVVTVAAVAEAGRLESGWLAVIRRDSAGGVVARRLLPAAILLPLLLGGVRLVALRAGLLEIDTGAAVVAMVSIVTLVVLVFANALPLDRADRARRDAVAQLRELNDSLDEKVRDRTAELEAANRELEAFVFAVSHDLTSPLRSMRAFVDLIDRRSARLDDDGKHYVALLRQGTDEMARLIGALVELSTITRADLRRERVDLSSVASSIVAELRRGDPGRAVDVAIDAGLTARADPSLARAALSNLLGNAWKFTAKREGAQISFGRLDGSASAFYVRDNGAGFDSDAADHLFAPFQRMHSQDEYPGTGLGLATVQRVVSRHGGRVWAEAQMGEGATFYFTLEPARA